MWRATFVVAAIALVPNSTLGDIIDDDMDPVEFQLQNELWELEHEGHHRHHGSKRFLGLLGGRPVVKPPQGLDAQLLPGRHPDVTRKLHDMDKELHNLKGIKENAAQAHLNLEGEVKDALKHIDGVVTIKSELAKTEVQIRTEERKLKKLQEDRKHLDMTHHSLSGSLHHIMEPKIEYAQARSQKRKRRLLEMQARDEEWRNKRDKYHAASLAMLEQRRKSKAELEASIVAEEKAHQERKAAENKYGADKKQTSFDIQAYRYSDAKERAAKSKEQRGEEEANQADVSVKRLEQIMTMEQRRVDNSMAIGKDKVNGKIRRVEDQEKESQAKLARLRNEYAAWSDRQQALASQIEQQKLTANAATKDFVDTQDDMLSSARDQVVFDAENDSDWDGWDEWPGRAGDHSIP